MPNDFELLFYAAFLGQIYLISWFLPNRIMARLRFILDNYPAAEYPKLYPLPEEVYRGRYRIFEIANRVLFVLGFAVLALVLTIDPVKISSDGYISEAWPAFYGMLQMLPLAGLEILACGQLRLMRRLHTSTRRRAELRRRGLLSSVPGAVLAIAGVFFFTAAAVDFLWIGEVESWEKRRSLWLALANLIMVVSGVISLRMARKNPYQPFEERARMISAQLTSVAYVSIAVSAIMLFSVADEIFGLDHLDAAVLSLYMQAIVALSVGNVMRLVRPENMNFEVYREAPSA
ncbi:MAG: hypothetical protein AAF725_01545 [Acidobacteriota bacterium]